MVGFDAREELMEAIDELGLSPHEVLIDEAAHYVEDRCAQHGPDMVRAQWTLIINEFSATGSDLV